ncbi:MAG: outer membrane lipoprotein-sorting protein, partial [bacterium]
LESAKLLEKYSAALVTEEVISVPYEKPRRCYVVDLTAKVKEVTYYRRVVWVDKEWLVPLKEELFAKSGKKLKVMATGDIKRFNKRYYPLYSTITNLLRKNSFTELFITKIQFDLAVDPKYFSQAVLTK